MVEFVEGEDVKSVVAGGERGSESSGVKRCI